MTYYNHQTRAIVPARMFCLMPGDGTVYRFGFFEPYKIQDRVTIETDNSPETISGNPIPKQVGQPLANTELHNLLTGVGDGSNYIYIWIDNNDNGGVMTWMPRWSIENFDHRILHENQHRFGKTNIYTLAAILLAVTVLIKNSSDLIGACKKALEAPALLANYQEFYMNDSVEEDDDEGNV